MITRDDINNFLTQIKGYIDSSNANLKKEIIEYINQRNQDLKNFTEDRIKINENNFRDILENKLDTYKTDLLKQINNQMNKISSELSNNKIILSTLQTEFAQLKKELLEIKKNNADLTIKLKNIKNIL